MASHESKCLAIGVDLGGTNMRIGMVDHLGKVLKKIIVPTESGAGAKTILCNSFKRNIAFAKRV